MKELKEKLSYERAWGSPVEQWHWEGRSQRRLGRVPVTPKCPFSSSPRLSGSPPPPQAQGRFQRPLSLAGRLPGLCLLPMLITAADIWPGPQGSQGSVGGLGRAIRRAAPWEANMQVPLARRPQ